MKRMYIQRKMHTAKRGGYIFQSREGNVRKIMKEMQTLPFGIISEGAKSRVCKNRIFCGWQWICAHRRSGEQSIWSGQGKFHKRRRCVNCFARHWHEWGGVYCFFARVAVWWTMWSLTGRIWKMAGWRALAGKFAERGAKRGKAGTEYAVCESKILGETNGFHFHDKKHK